MSFKLFFKQRRVIAIVVLTFVSVYTAIILVIAFFNLYAFSKEAEDIARAPFPAAAYRRRTPITPSYSNILNGEPALSENDAVVFPRIVVIDNDINARPQSGLDRASIIIEFPAEGGITRFAAIFNPYVFVSAIGPVRSIRPYVLDFTEDIGALIAHSGGSEPALELVKSLNAAVADLDEIGPLGKYFWRDPALYAPHNLFTSSTLLTKALDDGAVIAPQNLSYKDVGWKWLTYATENNSFLKNEKNTPEGDRSHIENNAQNGKSILIDYSTNSYEVKFLYDELAQKYVRYQGGKKHTNRDGDPLIADTVIISFMRASAIDAVGRLDIKTIGDGNGFACIKAVCREIVWKKSSHGERIRFFVNNEELAFAPGVTWILIVPVGRSVVIGE